VLAAKRQRLLPAVPVHRRVSVGCEVQVSDGDGAGADLPLTKIVAALVGPSALGWLISPAGKDGARGSALRRRMYATMRGRSDTTISMSAANATVREIALLAEGCEGFARRLDVVEHADEADEGLSVLLRRLRSRGRAAFEVNEGRRAAPAVLSSTFT